MRLVEDAIYRTRSGTEVGLVMRRLVAGIGFRFNILVEYQPANNSQRYTNAQFELVDWRGYVYGASEPHPRDLIQFIEHNEETYYQ